MKRENHPILGEAYLYPRAIHSVFFPDRNDAVSRNRNREASSKEATLSKQRSFQKLSNPGAAFNFRPFELAPPPIGLYDPVLGRCASLLRTPATEMEFTQQELDNAIEVVKICASNYEDKNALEKALGRATAFYFIDQQPFWKQTKIFYNGTRECELDGGYRIYSSNAKTSALAAAGKLKNGSGEDGCDAHTQAATYYQIITSSAEVSLS